VTEIHGVGRIIAATVLGDLRRFPARDHFAACNGTAPIEASSGNRNIHRISRRGNRQFNQAIHVAAVGQIRNHGTTGRLYYDRKRAEGMTGKCALRALKRKIRTPSTPASLPMFVPSEAPSKRDREGTRGATLHPARPAHTPNRRPGAHPARPGHLAATD
jgi:hypothetical protein